jgi:hypothetical protein
MQQQSCNCLHELAVVARVHMRVLSSARHYLRSSIAYAADTATTTNTSYTTLQQTMERRAQAPPPAGDDEAGGQWQGGRGTDDPSREDKIGALFSAMAANPWACLLGVWALFVCWCLLALWGYQLYLVAIAQTTNERVRGVYHSGNNPHDRGVLRNCAAFLCAPVPPSRVPSMWRTVQVNSSSSSSSSGKGDSSSSSSSGSGLPVLSDADVKREMQAAAAARAAHAAAAAAAKDAAITSSSSSFAGASSRPCSYSADIDPALTTFADVATSGDYALEPVLQLQSQQNAEQDAQQSTERQLASAEPLSQEAHTDSHADSDEFTAAKAGHTHSTAEATAEQSPTAAAHSADSLPNDSSKGSEFDLDRDGAADEQRTSSSSGAVDSSSAALLPDTSPVRIAADRLGALALVSGVPDEALP